MTRRAWQLLGWLALAIGVGIGPLVAYHGLHAYHQSVRRILPAYDATASVLVLGASNMSRWPERDPETYASTFGSDVTNAASPGWTTEIVLSHLPLETDADVIVLGDLGSPDLAEGRSPVDAGYGVRNVVRELLATTHAEIVVLTLPGRMLRAEDGCDLVADTNWWIHGLLEWTDPRVTVVDLEIPHGDPYYLPDGSHLSPDGYALLGATLAPVVAARLHPMIARGAP